MAHGLEAEYHVVISSRQPQADAPPVIVEIGEVDPVGSISYADEINYGGEASFSVEPTKVPDDIAARFRNIRATPCEASIYREGKLMWGGPLLSCQLQGPTLTLNARGFWYYARYMYLETTQLFTSPTDQYTIAKTLVNHYQGLPYGNYGLDTSKIGLSGVERTRTYLYEETHNVFKRVQELAEKDNGFEIWVTPEDRELHFGQKGTDKTQSVFADEANIIDPNMFWSVAAEDIASEGFAVGISDDNPFIVASRSNTDLRTSWGRATVFRTAEGVTEFSTLGNHAQKLVDARDDQLLVPGPNVVPLEDSLPTDYETGDLITYANQVGNLGIITAERRLRMRRVRVDEEGVEEVSWELM